MSTTIKRYLDAAKARKENGEAGFSLVELIIVVVILAILAAVAIPMFGNIQDEAVKSAGKAAVANFASEGVAHIAVTKTPYTGPSTSQTADFSPNWAFTVTGGSSIATLCVKGVSTSPAVTYQNGPGC